MLNQNKETKESLATLKKPLQPSNYFQPQISCACYIPLYRAQGSIVHSTHKIPMLSVKTNLEFIKNVHYYDFSLPELLSTVITTHPLKPFSYPLYNPQDIEDGVQEDQLVFSRQDVENNVSIYVSKNLTYLEEDYTETKKELKLQQDKFLQTNPFLLKYSKLHSLPIYTSEGLLDIEKCENILELKDLLMPKIETANLTPTTNFSTTKSLTIDSSGEKLLSAKLHPELFTTSYVTCKAGE